LVFSPQRRRRARCGWTTKDLSVSLLDFLFGFQPSTQEEGKAEQQKTFLFLSLILFGFQPSTQEDGEVRLNSRRPFCFSPWFSLVFSPQLWRRERWGWTAEDLSVSLLNSLWFSALNAWGGRGEAEQQKTFLFLSFTLFGFQPSKQEEVNNRTTIEPFCFFSWFSLIFSP
jgi:hypothetical protein